MPATSERRETPLRSPAARWATAAVVAAVVFGVLDALWLGVVANRLYSSQLGHLLAPTPDFVAAGVFYLVYVAGLVHFAIRPLDADRALGVRVRDAALFGLVTYATWSLTSRAVFRDFPALVVAIDLTWGVVACSVVTLVTVRLLRRLGRL